MTTATFPTVSPETRPGSGAPPIIAMLVVITVVTLTLASATEFSTVARWAISVSCGIVAAAVVQALVNRHHRQ